MIPIYTERDLTNYEEIFNDPLPYEMDPNHEDIAILPTEDNIELAQYFSLVTRNEPKLLETSVESLIDSFRKRLFISIFNKRNDLVATGKIVSVGNLPNGKEIFELGSIWVPEQFRHNTNLNYGEEIYRQLLWRFQDKLIECTTTNESALGLSTRILRSKLGEHKMSVKELLTETPNKIREILGLQDDPISPFLLIPIPYSVISAYKEVHKEICVCSKAVTGCDPSQNTTSCVKRDKVCILRVNLPLFIELQDMVLSNRNDYNLLGRELDLSPTKYEIAI